MAELDEALHPNEEGTGRAGATSSDKVKQRREAKIAIAVGVVGAVIAWLAYKRQATSSTSTPGAAPVVSAGTAPPGGGYVAGYQGSGGQGAALGDIGNALQGIETQLSALSPSAVAGSGTGAGAGETVGAAGTPGSAAPGYGEVPVSGIPGGEGIILGPAGGNVYQVGGGAPVYFGNADNAQEGAAAAAAAGAGGGYAYTSPAYASQVASAPVKVGPGQF